MESLDFNKMIYKLELLTFSQLSEIKLVKVYKVSGKGEVSVEIEPKETTTH